MIRICERRLLVEVSKWYVVIQYHKWPALFFGLMPDRKDK